MREEQINYLVGRRFGSGHARLERKSAFALGEALSYREELSKLAPGELSARVANEKSKETAVLLAKAEREERERFFNQSHANANFDYWAKMAHWKLDEAIALSLGKAPERVDWKGVEPWRSVSRFAREYKQRRELALRAIPWKQLYDPVMPSIFIEWAKKLDLSVPQELADAVAAHGVRMTDWKALYEELKAMVDQVRAANREHTKKLVALTDNQQAEIGRLRTLNAELSTALEAASNVSAESVNAVGARERESLLKMIAGMAKGGYGYDSKAKRSAVPPEIASDLELAGIPLDVDTVRKWLKAASELLPPDQDE